MAKRKKVFCALYTGLDGQPLEVDERECIGEKTVKCDSCGWNPEVTERRKMALREMASRGKVKEWGKGIWRNKRRILPERVRAARLANRMTQTALGDAVGVSITAISHIECGDMIPGRKTLESIAETLHVTVEWLEGDVDEVQL